MDGWRHVREKLKRSALKDFFKETARKKGAAVAQFIPKAGSRITFTKENAHSCRKLGHDDFQEFLAPFS